ncbi:MAG: SOS response-associated peptidase [Planctomycetaceae bacterium]|nr:SOS response-associated peptidase [Planctomycetaceae bacterium]
MCGRYTLATDAEHLLVRFEAVGPLDWEPRYNIAPSQQAPVIRLQGPIRRAELLRWGFVPSWAKDVRIGYNMINARSEEIARSYKSALKSRRCLIPASGWYEWRDKKPFHFHFPDMELFAFAGLWETWRELTTFTLFTTSSVKTAAEYHDRMPVILNPADYDRWLDPGINGHELTDLLRPCDAALIASPANQAVGNVRNEGPEMLSGS